LGKQEKSENVRIRKGFQTREEKKINNEDEREREKKCVCELEKERERDRKCVCEREKEKEGEKVRVCRKMRG